MNERSYIVASFIGNYQHHMGLIDDKPLCEREPDIFNFFKEFYITLLTLSLNLTDMELCDKLQSHLNQQRDAFTIVKLSPYDLLDIHNSSVESLTKTNDDNFLRFSNIVLYESISCLYDTYSNNH